MSLAALVLPANAIGALVSEEVALRLRVEFGRDWERLRDEMRGVRAADGSPEDDVMLERFVNLLRKHESLLTAVAFVNREGLNEALRWVLERDSRDCLSRAASPSSS